MSVTKNEINHAAMDGTHSVSLVLLLFPNTFIFFLMLLLLSEQTTRKGGGGDTSMFRGHANVAVMRSSTVFSL